MLHPLMHRTIQKVNHGAGSVKVWRSDRKYIDELAARSHCPLDKFATRYQNDLAAHGNFNSGCCLLGT